MKTVKWPTIGSLPFKLRGKRLNVIVKGLCPLRCCNLFPKGLPQSIRTPEDRSRALVDDDFLPQCGTVRDCISNCMRTCGMDALDEGPIDPDSYWVDTNQENCLMGEMEIPPEEESFNAFIREIAAWPSPPHPDD